MEGEKYGPYESKRYCVENPDWIKSLVERAKAYAEEARSGSVEAFIETLINVFEAYIEEKFSKEKGE